MDFYSIESKLILLFSILLIGLILCSYLGGQSCLVDGFDIMGTYEDSNKNTATVKTNPNTSNTITVKKPDGTIMSEYTSSVGDTSRTFYNPNGAFAKISVDLKKITVTSADKKTITTFNSKTRPPTPAPSPAPSPAPAPAPSPTPAPPPATSSSYDNDENNELKIYSLFTDLFEDLGLSQLYLYAIIKQIDTQDKTVITFTCKCSDEKLKMYPADAEYLRVDNIFIQFHIINNHFILVDCDINLLEKHNIPIFGEKIIGNIIHNIFKNVKEFIENISF